MNQFVAITLIISPALAIGYLLLIYRKKEKLEKEKLPDDTPADDEWVFVKHNGFTLVMRYIEKIEIWDIMSHREKNKQVQKTRAALSKGKLIMVKWRGNNVPVTPETARSKGLKRVQNLKGVKYKKSF